MTFPFCLHCTCSVFFRPCEKAIYREKQCLYVIIKKYPVLCDNLEGWEVQEGGDIHIPMADSC